MISSERSSVQFIQYCPISFCPKLARTRRHVSSLKSTESLYITPISPIDYRCTNPVIPVLLTIIYYSHSLSYCSTYRINVVGMQSIIMSFCRLMHARLDRISYRIQQYIECRPVFMYIYTRALVFSYCTALHYLSIYLSLYLSN